MYKCREGDAMVTTSLMVFHILTITKKYPYRIVFTFDMWIDMGGRMAQVIKSINTRA